MGKKESVAEFLARGGKITKVPTQPSQAKLDTVKSTNAPATGASTIISLEDADLYHGESKKITVKKKSQPTIDISALPEELRKKYIDEVISAKQDEEDED